MSPRRRISSSSLSSSMREKRKEVAVGLCVAPALRDLEEVKGYSASREERRETRGQPAKRIIAKGKRSSTSDKVRRIA